MPSTNQDAAASSSATVRQTKIDNFEKLLKELQEMNNRLSEEQELESQSHRDIGEDEATVRRRREASDKGVEENLNYQLERLEQKKELQKQMDKASEGAFDTQPRGLPILYTPPVDEQSPEGQDGDDPPPPYEYHSKGHG